MEESVNAEETPPESENISTHVKSTAVVKYSSVNTPMSYSRLKYNTDLKLPPSNWLKSSAENYGLHHVLPHSTGFSSFLIAHMFPESIGEVDVVSDAENIKKLLKLPYSNGPVSMMVHRVENTLLIDEFDIHKHLLRQAETDWEWLKKFFFEHVFQSLSDKEKRLVYRNNSRYMLQQKSLVSKFLHYSLAEPENVENEEVVKIEEPLSLLSGDQALPEPGLEERLPDSTGHIFTRNVVWTFEDIQMLLGTDMPIFGGSTHPCISLRLRDVAKPINVLTGIDYWLDNLMSNVPEVVMCYHLDGIVQKYELIKTEDLPQLPDAKFSPNLIRDVAQNILSFLKSNATKAGHTYWLFKGKDDDVVKLYDLSSLCSDMLVDKELNPFTVPVGMLLYRVARNMKQTSNGSVSQPGTIRMLLKNCLSLLPKEKYPHIVTSAHYMLSDLYVPRDTDPSSPELIDEPISEEMPDEDEEREDSASSNSVPVDALCISTLQFPDVKYNQAPPLTGSVEERCKMSLIHVSEGLECLKYFDTKPESKNVEGQKKQEEPQMAKSFEAIPMPYEKLHPEGKVAVDKAKEAKGKRRKKPDKYGKKEALEESSEVVNYSLKALLCKQERDALPTWQVPEKMDNSSWKRHLCNLLLEKALLVYTTLSEHYYTSKRFGLSLRYISCLLNCSAIQQGLACLMLDRAGDANFCIFQDMNNIEKHKKDLQDEVTIVKNPQIPDNKPFYNFDVIPSPVHSHEQVLVKSLQCYEKAANIQNIDSFTKKIGNIYNELGTLYMNLAAGKFQVAPECITNEEFQLLLTKSEKHLGLGQKAFESLSDNTNLAVLHTNTGRLMRLRAHCSSDSQSSRLTDPQRHFYKKAQSSYLLALSVLGTRKTNPIFWDAINWELSTTLFTIATLTQDYPIFTVKSQEEVEREVADMLLQALKYCDLETAGLRQPLYQFRAAKIHHRLASLYHRAYRTQTCDEPKKKNMHQLCQLHYLKASKLLFMLEHPSDLLTVQLERVSLAEYISENSANNNMKVKILQGAIDLLCDCRSVLTIIEDSNRILTGKPIPGADLDMDSESMTYEKEEEERLVDLMEERLQFLLKSLVKLCMTNSNPKVSALSGVYKEIYSVLLKKGVTDSITHLIKVIDKLNEMKKC